MGLKEYRAKRDFSRTPEPEGKEEKARRSQELIYVIQKHQATHLHYDLRLEEEGVLKSWAIPKEPPLNPGVKRLAVETEDHPLGYEDFEGVIPEGEYGAGTVEIWDKGSYVPLELGPGKKIIEIKGKKLKGTYALIKIKSKNGSDKNWLFFKISKERAQIPSFPSFKSRKKVKK
ncbi:MAG: 3'-phosphoesterase [Candidatus Aminicenantes bacterium]|nr:3'-phosphoesterase [Candidatus Aminicenantes bacterium]